MARGPRAPRCAWLGALLWLAASVARAEPPNAEDLDEQARIAFDNSDFLAAAQLFEEAYAREPHAATKYNAALAWDNAGDAPRAADAYALALESGGLDDTRATQAQRRLGTLARQLALLSIVKPIGATATIAHVVDAPIPVRLHLSPGDHAITIHARDGRTFRRSITLHAGKLTTVAIDEAREPKRSAPPPRAAKVATRTPSERHAVVDSDEATTDPRWIAGWIVLGAGVANGAVAVGLGLAARSARDEFVEGGRIDADLRERAVTLRTATNVVVGVAGAAGVAGVALLITSSIDADATAAVTLQVSPGAVSVGLRF